MNIFATSPDAVACAVALDDKRLVKMVLETAQLLATSHNLLGGQGAGIYKTTHQNHPCAIWVRESSGNYGWTFRHFDALLSEYTARYARTHKCDDYFNLWEDHPTGIPSGGIRGFVNCTPHKGITDVHEAYKVTMNEKWVQDVENGRPPRWTNTTPPTWKMS